MQDDEAQVADWAQNLLAMFELEGVHIDVKEVLALAGRAAHGVVRPAAPVTTYIAGLAAGIAAGSGHADTEKSQRAALSAAKRAVAEYAAAAQQPSPVPSESRPADSNPAQGD